MDPRCTVWVAGTDSVPGRQRALDLLRAAPGVEPGPRVLVIEGGGAAVGATLGSGADATCFRDFVPDARFDTVLGVQAVEHLVTPARRLRGEAVRNLRDFFHAVRAWTTPGARFVLYAIVAGRLPRRAEEIRGLARLTRENVLPGGCPRVEDVVRATGAAWEIRGIDTVVPSTPHGGGGRPPHDRAWAFERGHVWSARFTLRRID
ncbi:class I SAM-dependent methyltransferase [Actinomadura graeca]|uniref:Class I SAM-dependent methyltransferase n=1 Tax=Actinomadura graeca TaxID=2750812 RepID=A0ABX8QYC2_9ACTN|nr:class I SAM-dependent methyltransferase [Actinomadura graeca]QXJ23790.1 class I SAM-dependent methyltransferase [Actinomadura graeca]